MLAGRDRSDKGGPRPSGFSLSLYDGRFGPASPAVVGDKGEAKPTVVKKVLIGTSQRGSCRLFQNMGYIVRGGRREASRLVAPKTPADWRGKGQYRRLLLWQSLVVLVSYMKRGISRSGQETKKVI